MKIRRLFGLDPDQDGPEIARRLLQIFKAGDVVIGAEHFQKLAQRTGTLRHAQDEVLLHAGIALGAFFHFGQAFEIEIATRTHTDHRLTRNLAREVRQHVDRQGTCGFQDDAFGVQHHQHGGADAVFGGDQHFGRVHPGQRRKSPVADPSNGGPIHEIVNALERDRLTRGQSRREAGPAFGLDKTILRPRRLAAQIARHAR